MAIIGCRYPALHTIFVVFPYLTSTGKMWERETKIPGKIPKNLTPLAGSHNKGLGTDGSIKTIRDISRVKK